MSFDIAINKSLGDCAIDVSLQSDATLVAIVGKSGIGKTTLLNCIAGLIQPDSGHITIGGHTLFDHATCLNISSDARHCGYVFQDSRLFPHMTVSENLTYGIARTRGSTAGISLDEASQLLDIGSLLTRKPANLSGGEVRRVAIGRALLSGPRFLLLDEPLASLDTERSEHILRTIERLCDELAIPTLYVSHDQSEVERLTETIIQLD